MLQQPIPQKTNHFVESGAIQLFSCHDNVLLCFWSKLPS